MVEVDKERGRIGLRLTEDPDVEGKSPEELAGVGTGDPRGRRRGGAAAATAADAAAATAAAAAAERRDGGDGGGSRDRR